jgi:lysophospholipase L1-like esterase
MTSPSSSRPPRAAGAQGRLATNLLLAVVSAAACVVALELGARALGLRTGYFLGMARRSCLQRSALLEWELRPRCTGRVQTAMVRTNALGLRSPELREDGSVRILSVGDSCTFGWNVGQDETYPAVLERLLNREATTARYEVVNAGIAGYSSYQGLVYLRERGLALRPRVVIIGFGFNELFRIGDDEARLARGRLLMPLLHLNDFLLERSALYRWTRWQVRTAGPRDLGYRVTPERYDRNLRAMVALLRAHGARPILLDFFTRPLTQAPERRFPETLAAVSRDLDVPLVVYEGPRLDIVHPTAQGYALLAAQIRDAIDRAGYLRDTSAGS